MDDTIAHTQAIHKLAFDSTFAELNIKGSDFDWVNRFVGKGNYFIVSSIFEERGIVDDVGQWVTKWVNNYQNIIKSCGVIPVTGFMYFNNLIDTLKFKKIIATGGMRDNASIILQYLNIEKQFDIISFEDIVNPKPNPEIFLKAANRIKIEPQDCIVFEDSIFGIRAAKAANMTVVALITTYERDILAKENPDIIIDDYFDLLDHAFEDFRDNNKNRLLK